jgi:hypothetical protein
VVDPAHVTRSALFDVAASALSQGAALVMYCSLDASTVVNGNIELRERR